MPVYTRPHKRKLAKRSRTLPVYGEGADKGKYFRCWNCGWVCNVDRDKLGDSDSGSGNEHTDYHEGHLYSTYDPPAGVLGPELLSNCSFETGDPPTGWTAGNSADLDRHADPNTGTYCLEINENGAASPYTRQNCNVIGGERYRCSVFVKEGTGTDWQIRVRDNENAVYVATIQGIATATYSQQSVEFVTLSGCSIIGIILVHNVSLGDGTNVLFDDVSLKKVHLLPGNASRYAVLGGDIGHYHVALNIVTPDGEPELIRHKYTPDISIGCPFCGTLNWRGDY